VCVFIYKSGQRFVPVRYVLFRRVRSTHGFKDYSFNQLLYSLSKCLSPSGCYYIHNSSYYTRRVNIVDGIFLLLLFLLFIGQRMCGGIQYLLFTIDIITGK